MRQNKFKEIIKEALAEFIRSPEGEALIGNIVIKGVNQAMTRKMLFEDGTSEPGRVIEKEQDVHVLEQLIIYLGRTEGALRGVQSDAAQARDRSGQVADILTTIADKIESRTLTDGANREKFKIANA